MSKKTGKAPGTLPAPATKGAATATSGATNRMISTEGEITLQIDLPCGHVLKPLKGRPAMRPVIVNRGPAAVVDELPAGAPGEPHSRSGS